MKEQVGLLVGRTRLSGWEVRATPPHPTSPNPTQTKPPDPRPLSNIQVWIQVETRECFDDIDAVLAVPGIHCAFLGEAAGRENGGVQPLLYD
jgi:hypothetical protein